MPGAHGLIRLYEWFRGGPLALKCSKLLSDFFRVILGTGVVRSLSLLNSLIIARSLGPSEFGKFSIYYMFLLIALQIPNAFDDTYVRLAKELSSRKEKHEYLKSSVICKLTFVLLGLILLYHFSGPAAEILVGNREFEDLLAQGVLAGICQSFANTVASVFQEQERFTRFTTVNTVFPLAIFVCLIAILVGEYDVTLPRVTRLYTCISVAIGLTSVTVIAVKAGNLLKIRAVPLKRTIGMAKWVLLTGVVFYLFSRIDLAIMARYIDYKELGIYSASCQLVMIVSLMATSVSVIFLPKSVNAASSMECLQAYKRVSYIPSLIVCLPICFLLLLADQAIHLIYGADYAGGAGVLRVLLVGWSVYVFYIPLSLVFYAIDESRTRFLVESGKLITAIGLLLLLIPAYGMIGGAISMSVALLLNGVVGTLVLHYRFKKRLNNLAQERIAV